MKRLPRKRAIGLWIIALATLIGLAAIALSVARGIASRDEPSAPPDDDLRVSWPEIDEERNGYDFIHFVDVEHRTEDGGVVQLPDWPVEDEEVYATSSGWDEKAASALLDRNAEVLSRFEKSLAFEILVVPPERWDSIGALSNDDLTAWVDVGRLVLCRSRLRFEQGRKGEALGDVDKVWRFGSRVAGSRSGLHGYAAGTRLASAALEMLFWLVNTGGYRCADLNPWTAALGTSSREVFRIEESLRQDYTRMRSFVLRGARALADGEAALDAEEFGLGLWAKLFPDEAHFKPNQTLRRLGETYRLALKWAGQTHVRRREEAKRLIDDRRDEEEKTTTFNAVGKAMVQASAQSLPRVLMAEAKLEFHRGALRAVIALKCYSEEHGRLPDRLEALVPEYLSEVPLDAVDDRPLRYSVAGRMLYSIGSDGVDSGGSQRLDPAEALADDLEPTFRLSF